MELGRVNIWISHQSIFLAESRKERGWLICFKLCSYHVALDQWPHRSKSKTVSNVQSGVCKELCATLEIAELRVNNHVFTSECKINEIPLITTILTESKALFVVCYNLWRISSCDRTMVFHRNKIHPQVLYIGLSRLIVFSQYIFRQKKVMLSVCKA